MGGRPLRVVEYYVSYQGEGPNTSKPTVFVRFAGCNFKCPGWPCDTQHAIDPKIYRGLQKLYAPAVLAEVISKLGVRNICLTGGEVFLQDGEALNMFVNDLFERRQHTIEVFTNGALKWDQLMVVKCDTIVLDWKLAGSGEEYDNDNIGKNLQSLDYTDAVKFTIATPDDYRQAKARFERWKGFFTATNAPQIYAGVVWDSKVTTEQLCEWMIEDKLPWNLNVQTHKFIWDPNKIGV
jgi:7-carboxy-7-deazaguanine synthase